MRTQVVAVCIAALMLAGCMDTEAERARANAELERSRAVAAQADAQLTEARAVSSTLGSLAGQLERSNSALVAAQESRAAELRATLLLVAMLAVVSMGMSVAVVLIVSRRGQPRIVYVEQPAQLEPGARAQLDALTRAVWRMERKESMRQLSSGRDS